MRISDWSSDVCSSDLLVDIALDRRRRLLDGAGALEFIELLRVRKLLRGGAAFLEDGDHLFEFGVELGDRVARRNMTMHQPLRDALDDRGLLARILQILEIGRTSCRESVCPYVKISWVAGTYKKKE